ncbi:CHAP domain containing protein [Gluconacetobacter diazotrophicus PA1 5]|uniref:Putative CHAP protein n=1 Tax=Gluconacetobacter diazotrophicus (strain ATCC 49037 / DSM 5601 / CCUG 37298 / CIP 103539 / LMG 7603 / PAl5) TaxID=272568 RepID=A9HC21_GLUDA|nr:CHAP domain-containing protein [Gluconacetobacter diazotrophicus]ACI50864.1 CHAP domain containing protein [Gluconacetobacter diazotrophicus PA1 5]TWB08682.1 CHAP domain-containing protein [Gluconacetobacter diazotrophicus]CAP54887.1 putative CHAP protein [Gluconacetobacter diazotrophicus PA1 5]
MRAGGLGRSFLFSMAAASLGLILPHAADARRPAHHVAQPVQHGHHVQHAAYRRHEAGHVIQCVAFAKTASDVVLHGNAVNWWYNAAGVYARGSAPEAGSVLNFRATRRMPLGHVAVVTNVIDSRTVTIDQSHWAQRGISRNVSVIDVSPNNDWSAVRVALAHQGTYGSIYPTYGFIYPRSDTSGRVMMASAGRSAVRATDSALSHPMRSTEVAEAPDSLPVVTYGHAFRDDAPDRSIR